MISSYVAAVTQQPMHPVYKGVDGAFRPECIRENLDRVCGLVAEAAKEHQAKLVVFPEFCVQGYALERTVLDWERAGVTLPGPETAAMAKVARATGAHIAGGIYERIPDFPGRYFMSGFLISPEGNSPEDQLKLVYRKVYALTHKTRPGDIYAQYIAKYGRAALFPVADTPLGKLGCAVAADIAWPEAVRALSMRGAELVFNPTGAAQTPGYASATEGPEQAVGPAMAMVRRVRAWENTLYLAMANIGAFYDDDGRGNAPRVPAEVVDYQGRVIARANTPEQALVPAVIDMAALRKYRAQPKSNFLAQLQPKLHAQDYELLRLCDLNGMPTPHAGEQEPVDFIAETWKRMVASGAFNG
ncbi:MAG: nitrilase-related carbon-nitrogen hydrolase [Rhodospirillaceae bacterium]|nr:nitrilase-related carbon-nitrogen hydrolase [Rhodospirillaceae bacterium]